MSRTKRACNQRYIDDGTLETEYNELLCDLETASYKFQIKWALKALAGKTSLDEWKRHAKAKRTSDDGDGWFRCYHRGYCGGPVHPISGKIYGWDDDLPRHRDMMRLTNRKRRADGKKVIDIELAAIYNGDYDE